VNRPPSHGFPGGPPSPPFGDVDASRVQPIPVDVPVEPAPATADVSPLVQARPKSAWRTAVGAFLATAVLAGAVVSLTTSRPSDPPPEDPLGETTSTTEPVEETPPTTPPTTLPAQEPSLEAGDGFFVPVDVAACSGILGPVGASNYFTTGTPIQPENRLRLEGTGSLGDPVWKVELDDTLQVASLVVDAPSPQVALRGISDNHVVVFAPFSVDGGSNFAVYRANNGELVWTSAVPRGVAVASDSKRVYLVDSRASEATLLAVVAPGRATIVGCHAASGAPAPTPNVSDATLLVKDGRAFLVSPGTNLVQVVEDDQVVLEFATPDAPLALRAVISDADGAEVLVSSNRQVGDALRLSGFSLSSPVPLEGGTLVFDLSPSELADGEMPARWDDPSSDTGALLNASPPAAEDIDGWDLRGVLAVGDRVVVSLVSPSGQFLSSVDISGSVSWTAPAPNAAWSYWRASGSTVHIGRQALGPDEPPPWSVVFDAATGESLGRTDAVRSIPAVGAEVAAYAMPPWNQSGHVVVLYEASVVGAVVGAAEFVAPVAAAPGILVVYVEDSGRRYLVAFLLDPEALDVGEAVQ
jgi:hypothetical protein